jgi:hypothetical protein
MPADKVSHSKRGDDARNEVEWEGPFLTAQRERDATFCESSTQLLVARLQFVGLEVEQRVDDFLVDRDEEHQAQRKPHPTREMDRIQ